MFTGLSGGPDTVMVYLLDTDVLITAKSQYYEFGRVDQYWEWLVYNAQQGKVKIPTEIYEEITAGSDELVAWAKKNKAVLVLDEEVDTDLLRRVMDKGYAPDLTSDEIEAIGKDPFLIAYALADVDNRIVVTREVRTNQVRHNRKVPSVCDSLKIKSCDPWRFGRDLDFRA